MAGVQLLVAKREQKISAENKLRTGRHTAVRSLFVFVFLMAFSESV